MSIMMSENYAENLYLNRAKLVMRFLGVWLPPENESLQRKVYRFFMLSLQYIFLIFQIVYIIQVWGDLEAVSQATYVLFTQACLCFKVTVFLVNKEMLGSLLAQMNSDIFCPRSVEHEKILQYQAARIKRLLLAFMVCSQATCCLWALKPLLDDSGSREFPFRMWMPVSTENSVQYSFGFAFQLLTSCMSAYMYFGVDSVTLSMVIFGCAQIYVIKDKLLTQIKPVTEKDRITIKKGDNTVLEDNYKKFIDCVVHHQAIVKFTEMVEDTYHTYLFFQLSGSVGLICMSALRILVVDWQSTQFLSIVAYLGSMVMQMYICCWCGHELTATSEELFVAVTACPWYEQSLKFKKVMLFTMMRLKRPLVFRAGHYVTLSRQTFVSILRLSYSYFAVLQQTKPEE